MSKTRDYIAVEKQWWKSSIGCDHLYQTSKRWIKFDSSPISVWWWWELSLHWDLIFTVAFFLRGPLGIWVVELSWPSDSVEIRVVVWTTIPVLTNDKDVYMLSCILMSSHLMLCCSSEECLSRADWGMIGVGWYVAALWPSVVGGGGIPKRSVGLVTRFDRRVSSNENVDVVCGEVGWLTLVSTGFPCSMSRRSSYLKVLPMYVAGHWR